MGNQTFGGTIKLQGEREYRQAISQINSDLKVLGSELGKVTAEFGKNDKSVEGLTSKNKVLSDQIEAQKSKIATLRAALDESSEKYGENDKRTQAWQVSLNKAETELIKMQKELGNNNSELDRAKTLNEETTASVNKFDNEIKKLEGDLAAVDVKYKGNANSVEALKEKQDILNQILEKQQGKVKTLQDALDASKSAFGENSDETKKWQSALSEAEKELNGTEKELKNVDKEMQKAQKSTGSFGDVLKANLTAEAIKEGIKKLGDTIKEIGKYLGDAIKSASEYGREISLMSEKTGISTDTLQKFKAASKTTGVEVEQFTGSLARSIKSMGAASDGSGAAAKAYKALGISVTDSNGELRNSEEVYWQTIDALKSMENETQRDALAMQLFGKSAMELNPIIKRGSEGFQELTKDMSTFDESTIESLRGLDISLERFGNTMDNIKRSIGVAFAPMMKEIADAASGVGSRFKDLFMSIAKNEDQAEINKKFDQLRDSIIVLAEKIKEQMPKFIEVGKKILSALWDGVQVALGPFLPKLIGIGAILATVIAGWGVLMSSAALAWPALLIVALVGLITAFWPQISKFFSDLWAGISEFMGSLWDNITNFLETHWQDLLLWIFAWPAALIKTLIDFWPQISAWLSGIWNSVKNWLGSVWSNISSWFIELKNNMVSKTKDMLTATVDWFKKLPGDIWNAIIGAVQKVAQWGSDLVTRGRQAANDLWHSIINIVRNLPNELWNIGRNIVEGLWNGINGMMAWIKDRIMSFAKNVTDWLKSFFGIESPSKLFRDQIGKNLALGIGEGFTNEMDAISKEMQSAIPTSFDYDLNPSVNNANFDNAQSLQTAAISAVNDPDYLISAFQRALSGMAFQINDDKIGELIINKVEKVIFC